VRTGKSAESFKRHIHRRLASDRLFNLTPQRIDDLFIQIAKELDCEMHLGRLHPGDARVPLHLRLNALLQLLLESRKLGSQPRRQFDGKKRPDHFKLALFMTVRREMPQRRATSAKSETRVTR
jgi:hypothetical protein